MDIAACKDLTGLQFGELIVVSKSDRRASNGGVYWNCKCSCGCEKEILGQSLKNGKTISCGHKGKENLENCGGRHRQRGGFHDLGQACHGQTSFYRGSGKIRGVENI